MEVQGLFCALVVEHVKAASGAVSTRECHKRAELSLARNEFREVLLLLDVPGRPRRKMTLRQDRMKVHRKFASDGKLTVTLEDVGMRLLVSNAPPHRLAVFAKSMAAKLAPDCDENSRPPPPTARERLRSNLPSAVDEISPVTAKDVQNLKRAEAGGKGLLKLNVVTASPVTTGRAKKRTRLGEKQGGGSPREDGGAPAKRRSLEEKQNQVVLTKDQRKVLQAVKEGHNVFFTGGAGVGKSLVVRKCIGALPPDSTVVTASTGVAAYQVGGVTLHSFAGVATGAASVEQCVEAVRRKKGAIDAWRRCRHLVVDEVSMVDGRYFEKLEAVARAVRNSEKPFGGIQLILAGDFLQLPPVTRKGEKRVFCFQTEAWRRCVQVNIELTIVKRQSDTDFVDILASLRKGECSLAQERILRATCNNRIEDDHILATRLCTHTEDANMINREELASLPGDAKLFSATDSHPALTPHLDQHTPVESRLTLKVGAQVMLMKNLNVARGLVNGARGRVVRFSRTGNWPVVRFACGREEEVRPEKWPVKGRQGGADAAALWRKQLPLRLAWAFSIHKSQGMTLECAEVNLSKVFECGQAYVALSRAKSLKSTRIVGFSRDCIVADPKVLRFYRNLAHLKPVELSRQT